MAETKAPAVPTRRSTAAFVLAGISLVLSLLTCGVAGVMAISTELDPLPVHSKPEVASAAQVEAVAQASLPPGTVLLGAAYSHGLQALAGRAARGSRMDWPRLRRVSQVRPRPVSSSSTV